MRFYYTRGASDGADGYTMTAEIDAAVPKLYNHFCMDDIDRLLQLSYVSLSL